MPEQSTTVWVVSYYHRHGRDVWVCATELRARQTVFDAMEEFLEEVDDDGMEKELRSCIAKKDYASAAKNWESATSESFEISAHPVLT